MVWGFLQDYAADESESVQCVEGDQFEVVSLAGLVGHHGELEVHPADGNLVSFFLATSQGKSLKSTAKSPHPFPVSCRHPFMDKAR